MLLRYSCPGPITAGRASKNRTPRSGAPNAATPAAVRTIHTSLKCLIGQPNWSTTAGNGTGTGDVTGSAAVSVAGNAAATMTTGSVYDRGGCRRNRLPSVCSGARPTIMGSPSTMIWPRLIWTGGTAIWKAIGSRCGCGGPPSTPTPTDTGAGFLRRSDINGSLPDDGPADLCVLYRAAAWYRHLLTVQTL